MYHLWKWTKGLKISSHHKIVLYIAVSMLITALFGALVWGLVGRLFLPDISWCICFIGYPAIIFGFLGAILFLYNHEFDV